MKPEMVRALLSAPGGMRRTEANQMGMSRRLDALTRSEGRGLQTPPSPPRARPEPPAAVVRPTPTPLPATEQSRPLEELARLYVDQYQKVTGVSLSDEEIAAKRDGVTRLYGRLGAQRLEAIVFKDSD